MGNRYQGEIEFSAGGDKYKLSFSADAFAEIEDATGRSLNEIADLFQNPDNITAKDLRIFFWKGLADCQPDVDFDAARKILKKLTPTEMATLVGRAFVASMPAVEEGEPANPPKPDSPPAGIGNDSSLNGASSG